MTAGGTMKVEAGPLGPNVSGSALEPFALVVFGASGDLARRKLLPALFELHRKKFLPERYVVIGAARSDLGDAGFRGLLQGDGSDLEEFRSRLRYIRLDYSDGGDYERLAAMIRTEGFGDSLKVFHLAVPPSVHGKITRLLAEAGLSGTSGSTARLVLEKPFGHDLQSARKLCGEISAHFSERQVFRIDHYLAKETVQNLLVFRFANSIFEPLWNRNHIRQVEIYATETEGVGSRAGYYDGVGVLRDMVQNHMLQLLALCALEPPAGLD
ncbi:MAG: glucose-6-phosphate dehydrogenase, partial [Deltaproteobacteria bacterium]